MLKRIRATMEISRPHNMVAAMACLFSGYYLSGGRGMAPVLYPLAFTGLITACGNMINDYFDADIDSINKPRRPIPSGRLSKGYVLALYVVCSILVSALLIFSLPRGLLLLMLAWELLLFFYAGRAKRLPLVGNVVVGLVAASAFPAGAMVTGNVGSAVFPFLFAFVFILGRELVKGAEDYEGDSLSGASTLPVVLGVEKAMLIASFFLLFCVVIAPLPSLVNYFGRTYFLLMEFLVVPGLLLVSYLVLTSPRRTVLNRASWILKGEMFLGIVVMGLGKV